MKARLFLQIAGMATMGFFSGARAAAPSRDMPGVPSDLPSLENRLAVEPDHAATLLRAALEYHDRAAFDDEEGRRMLRRARETVAVLLRVDPGSVPGRALEGSCVVISAREPLWPPARLRRVREGNRLMDAAVAADPNDADARFIRCSNNLFLPDFFDRRKTVEEDFQWLRERVDRGDFTEEFRQYVLLYHGLALLRRGDRQQALVLWEAGLRIRPQSPVAAELGDAIAGTSPLARQALR
ncbi:MAG: hypothetical protein KF791_12655 [Verrucomicrobiae bacterium]|nr:hypothetical protein [Verrucomicrobiae bacterium]